jgi:NOL1/NOP2/fmu family ribosome biogenesis protein
MPKDYEEYKDKYPGLWFTKEELDSKPIKTNRIKKKLKISKDGLELNDMNHIDRASGIKRGFGIVWRKKI